jgi:hypothetical protein
MGGSVVFQRKPSTMAPSFDIKRYFRSISAHEFIDLYCKYEASGRRGTDSFKYTGTTLLHNSGHRLNHRTVACLKRIIQVRFFLSLPSCLIFRIVEMDVDVHQFYVYDVRSLLLNQRFMIAKELPAGRFSSTASTITKASSMPAIKANQVQVYRR